MGTRTSAGVINGWFRSSRGARWPVILALALSCEGLAQGLSEPQSDSEQQYRELIQEMQEEGGITAPGLSEPLTAIGQQYFARQAYERAGDAFG